METIHRYRSCDAAIKLRYLDIYLSYIIDLIIFDRTGKRRDGFKSSLPHTLGRI